MSDPAHGKPSGPSSAAKPVVIKKYANRRLYNTESSSYITLENLAEMVRQGREFVVYDAKTNEDITRAVLTQIIVEQEGKGGAMLPTSFLRQLIGLYGEDMQGLVPRYLEQAMAAFTRQQEQMQETMRQTVGKLMPPGLGTGLPSGFEEATRQNLAMMERAMNLFSPFPRPPPAETTQPHPEDELVTLRAEVEKLRHELAIERARVTKTKKPSGGAT